MEKLSKPIISLLTDFGLKDPFVGIMKGVILNINPNVNIVDITHEVESHNILEGAMILGSAYPYLPKGTIFLTVVDPGVGSERRPILAETDDYCFIAPDNGLLSNVYKDTALKKVLEITSSQFFLNEVSDSFHGRDIFAPIASWLSKGTDLSEFGHEIDDYIRISVPKPKSEHNRIKGEIIYIDKFGNLISNINQSLFEKALSASSKRKVRVAIGPHEIHKISRSYIEAKKDEASALFNSFGNLEIFALMKSASSLFDMEKGEEITVTFI